MLFVSNQPFEVWLVTKVRWFLSKGVGWLDGYAWIQDPVLIKIIHHNPESNLSSMFRFDSRVLFSFIAEYISGRRAKTT